VIVIVDSGGANLVSITSAFARLGADVLVSGLKQDIERASHVILPGVGSAQNIMHRLRELNLVDVLKSLTQPVLGICVGMQILFEFSEEGSTECLGILTGSIKKLPRAPDLTLPHMGWNTLQTMGASPLMKNILPDAYVYFVHSFAATISPNTIAQTHYGTPFSAAVQQRNFMGVQFHPERSGEIGCQILKNFCNLTVESTLTV